MFLHLDSLRFRQFIFLLQSFGSLLDLVFDQFNRPLFELFLLLGPVSDDRSHLLLEEASLLKVGIQHVEIGPLEVVTFKLNLKSF